MTVPVGKARLLHMIGNAHIDPVWLWQWPEGYQEVRATFQSALERMDEYPEFIFTSDSVCYFEWVEETDPELFQAIKRRVSEGRWQIVGGWWVEPDCNIPSGESFVRQGLYGQRYLRDRFGAIATTGSNVDPFGHNATIPQLLRGSGMDSYVFLRPGPHELALPGPLFWWESTDGSRVLAYRIPHEYASAGTDLGYQVDKSLAQLPPEQAELMVFYGVGNHGGGPTRANLDSIRRLNAMDGLPRLECSSPRAFFDRVSANGDIPVHQGELQHHCVGCYTAHSGVKQWNRRAENALQRAEKWAVVADVVAGLRYPLAELTEAWKLTLFNQFHDTLAGTAIEPAYDDARDQLGHASSVAAAVFNRSIQSLARRIDIAAEPDVAPVVVFNAHPWPVRTCVELEFAGYPGGRAARMRDDEGRPVAVQRTRSYATTGSRTRLIFGAELPPLGYRVYRIEPGTPAAEGPVDATQTTLENEMLALEVDPATGWLARLRDKRTGAELAPERPGQHAVVIADSSDTWGHWVRAYDDVIGGFECTSVRLVEHGPVRAVLRVESRYGASTLVEELVLAAGATHVEARVQLDWRERHKLLKLRFPTALASEHATFEVPYGHVERASRGDEEPGQAWVDVAGELPGGARAGLALVNDSKYGYDVRGGEIGLTVARSPVYAWHVPKELDEDGIYEYLDQGRQSFTYALVPHAGDWRAAGVVRLALELNQRPFPLLESYHAGNLPLRASYAAAADQSVVVTVVKADEDGDGDVVVRAYESAGRAAHASIDLPLLERTIEADFGAAEIKTFRVPRNPEAPIVETNLLEWAEEPAGQPPTGPEEPSAETPTRDARDEGEPAPQEGPALGTADSPAER
jgi:alpha-mannosidase